MKTAILIPSYQPDRSLLILAASLQNRSSSFLLVVDDGSGEKYRRIFDTLENSGVAVVRHKANRGKGAALKTGIAALLRRCPDLGGIVTADGDGQHLPTDIERVRSAMESRPDALTLGTRSFRGREVPLRSKIGNRFSALYFETDTGVRCSDTQTGLRGIPKALFRLALETPGDRYDYEMNFLTACAKSRCALNPVPITTLYSPAGHSHFCTIKDSARIYRTPLLFACASLASAAVDLSLFAALSFLLPETFYRLMAATAAARCISGLVNFTLNRRFSFCSRQPAAWDAAKYTVLFAAVMFSSGTLVSLLTYLGAAAVPAKIAVDAILFFVSYFVQKNWVFKSGESEAH